jgi:lactobin A/cerein 7B family class IIb bacteriocin
MKNLEIFDVVLLDNDELKRTNGGILGPIIGALALAGVAFKWGWDLGREYASTH